MSAISSFSVRLQNLSPLEFIRTLFVLLGDLIRWIGQCLIAKNDKARFSEDRMQGFAIAQQAAKQNTGKMSDEEMQAVSTEIETVLTFFNESRDTEETIDTKEKEKMHSQFVRDAIRTASGRNVIIVNGKTFSKHDPQYRRAYANDLIKNKKEDSEDVESDFFANHLIKKALIDKKGNLYKNHSKWSGVIQGVICQQFAIPVTRLDNLMKVCMEAAGMSVGTSTDVQTFPRETNMCFIEEDEKIVGIDLEYTIGYAVQNPKLNELKHGHLGNIQIKSEMSITFDDQDKVCVSNGKIDMQAMQTNQLAIKQIEYICSNSPSVSLIESIRHWTFWGVNALSGGRLEMCTISPYVNQMTKYISCGGSEEVAEIRKHLKQMRKLYEETGAELYNKAARAQVRALFREEIANLDCSKVEESLSTFIKDQLEHRTEDKDREMFVRDNKTRSIMKTHVVFPPSKERPYAEYNSEAFYYARDKTGDERQYFKALQAELHERYPDENPVRNMVQALMTQKIISAFTADLFKKTENDGYSRPGDISGAAESSIVVHSDKRITYVFKTRYNLTSTDIIGTDIQSADQISVDVALDLRYENEAWVPQIVKRDIQVIPSP